MDLAILYSRYPEFPQFENQKLAQIDFQKAIQADPRNFIARYQYAVMLTSQGDTRQAIAVLKMGSNYPYLVDNEMQRNMLQQYLYLYQQLVKHEKIGKLFTQKTLPLSVVQVANQISNGMSGVSYPSKTK